MKDKNAIIEQAGEAGFHFESTYYGCAQCTIAAVQDTLGIRDDSLFKAASGFAAGCGGTCSGVCGGLTGGVMVMGSCFGRTRPGFDGEAEEKLCSSLMAKELYTQFVEHYESAICKEIHRDIFGRTFDFWNPEEKQIFEDAGAHTDKCPAVVANASRWTTELILNELERREISLDELRKSFN